MVRGRTLSHVINFVHNPPADEVRVKVGLVIDDSEHLALDANCRGHILWSQGLEGGEVEVAEDAIVEGRLVLRTNDTKRSPESVSDGGAAKCKGGDFARPDTHDKSSPG